MSELKPKIRLFVDAPLQAGLAVAPTESQAHYLLRVMRLGRGDEVALFNGRDGEWQARIAEAGKKSCLLEPQSRLRPQTPEPDLWLLFAPIRKTRLSFVIEKATELGVARLQPVLTRRTGKERLREDKVQAYAVEAAEQCERLSLPEIHEPLSLERLLADWPEERPILFCRERGAAEPAAALLARETPGPWAVLIGPEGGFAPEEIDLIAAHPAVRTVHLGPRILRAETAALAALSLWQAHLGDWGD